MAKVTTVKVDDERQVVIIRELRGDETLSVRELSFLDVRIASSALRQHLLGLVPEDLPPETTRTEPAPAP